MKIHDSQLKTTYYTSPSEATPYAEVNDAAAVLDDMGMAA